MVQFLPNNGAAVKCQGQRMADRLDKAEGGGHRAVVAMLRQLGG
jgi:hypothetical protein